MNIWIIDGDTIDQALRRLQTDYDLCNEKEQSLLIQKIDVLEWVKSKSVRVKENRVDTSEIEFEELVKTKRK